ncbi:hypothetical protein [Mycetohabitans sp. B8]|uniref:hypothetical protein n=1 Tax=Mycetohabitans sp. B8 TaxID=2841845 RepID=UPI0034CDE895
MDQEISKQGNRRVRTQLIEMAWCRLRYQPSSAPAQWCLGGAQRGDRVHRALIPCAGKDPGTVHATGVPFD